MYRTNGLSDFEFSNFLAEFLGVVEELYEKWDCLMVVESGGEVYASGVSEVDKRRAMFSAAIRVREILNSPSTLVQYEQIKELLDSYLESQNLPKNTISIELRDDTVFVKERIENSA